MLCRVRLEETRRDVLCSVQGGGGGACALLRYTRPTTTHDGPLAPPPPRATCARSLGRPQPARCADAGADEEAEGGWQNTDVEWDSVEASRRGNRDDESERAHTQAHRQRLLTRTVSTPSKATTYCTYPQNLLSHQTTQCSSST